jgi:predicted RNA-binding protein YlxR (DUF448 family)
MARLALDVNEANAGSELGEVAAACRKGARAAPRRSCILTREALSPNELIRFVLSPAGEVVADIRRVLPGRGVWVTANRSKVAEAVKRRAFARAFKKPVEVAADLGDVVGKLLRKDALQALSLANKAGAVTTGFEKVRSALIAGKVVALVEARDASPDSRRKLAFLLEQGAADCAPTIIDEFASDELNLALGRSHVIHVAVLEAPIAGLVLTKSLRLRRFEFIDKQS